MNERYARNLPTLTVEEMQVIRAANVAVVGCGGLGGHVIEQLARLGIGRLTVVDGGSFEASNLNRQLLATDHTMGMAKVRAARERIQIVNPGVEVTTHAVNVTRANATEILQGHQVIVDALDNVPDRLLLEEQAENLAIPLVHGAIGDWYGQVTTIFPGDRTLARLYAHAQPDGSLRSGNPPFIPALVASLQVAETVKVLLRRGDLFRGRVLMVNTLDHEYDIVAFDSTSY